MIVEISGEDLNWFTVKIAIELIITCYIHPEEDFMRVTIDTSFFIINVYILIRVCVNEIVKNIV